LEPTQRVGEERVDPVGGRAHWDSVHGRLAPEEVSWFQADPRASLGLVARADKWPRGRILDVGGGASRLVDVLLAAGYEDVSVLDLSPAALARAGERLGDRASRVQWIAADVTRWVPQRTYDVWHDRACFHFLVDPADRKAYRRALAAAVAPGGQVVIATFAPDGPERCSGLPVVRWSADALAGELGPAYRQVEAFTEAHPTPRGTVQRFQFCRFLRR
jgi:SAM-dependent methyltransferase